MMRVNSLSAKAAVPILIAGFCGGALAAQRPERRAWSILEADVRNKSVERRVEAVGALALLPGNPRALRMARQALTDAAPEVRAAAATSLGQMASTDSIPELRKMLADDNPSVVIAAANALWNLKDPTAYEVYYEILTGKRKSGASLETQAMETLHNPSKLARLGIEQGIQFVPYVNYGYSAFRLLTKDAASPVRAAAARALEGDPDPRTIRALVRATDDKSSTVRIAALAAVARRGDPTLLKGIVPALWDTNSGVRDVAAAAVIRLITIANAVGTAAEGPKPPVHSHK
jgi:HEAT repeat protein